MIINKGTPFDDDYSEDSRCEDNSSESGVELTDDDEWSGKEDRNDFGSNKNVPKTDNDDGDDVMLQRFKDKFKQLTNVR